MWCGRCRNLMAPRLTRAGTVVYDLNGEPLFLRVASRTREVLPQRGMALAHQHGGGAGQRGPRLGIVALRGSQEAVSLQGKGLGVRDPRSLGAGMDSSAFFLAAGPPTGRQDHAPGLPMAYPSGSRWSPRTWMRILKWRWKLYGPVTDAERRGYWFWLPVVLFVLLIELLGALSATFKDAIPWPTISSTIGHLEKRWDWVAVIVLGLITIVALHVVAYHVQRRTSGRAYRRVGPSPADKPKAKPLTWYNWIFVVLVGAIAIVLAVLSDASKYQLGYVIYGVLAFFGIVLPSVLAFSTNRLVEFPTLFFTIARLRHRLHAVAVIIVAGLTILAVHLAFYPWPDIAHESATFVGLNPDAARRKAEGELRKLRGGRPNLQYSTQARTVVDGSDVWSVYFRPANGTGPSCVVTVTKKELISATPECSS
jgi:hypothetical protein